MNRHEWLVIASASNFGAYDTWRRVLDDRKRVLDETGLDLRPTELVLERCATCGLQRAVTLREGSTGDRWRTVAQRRPGEPWSRSRTVGACQGRTA